MLAEACFWGEMGVLGIKTLRRWVGGWRDLGISGIIHAKTLITARRWE